jgi:hypothetical protein
MVWCSLARPIKSKNSPRVAIPTAARVPYASAQLSRSSRIGIVYGWRHQCPWRKTPPRSKPESRAGEQATNRTEYPWWPTTTASCPNSRPIRTAARRNAQHQQTRFGQPGAALQRLREGSCAVSSPAPVFAAMRGINVISRIPRNSSNSSSSRGPEGGRRCQVWCQSPALHVF